MSKQFQRYQSFNQQLIIIWKYFKIFNHKFQLDSTISCSDFTSESTCVLQRQNFIEDDPLLCRWTDNHCEEALDVSHLDFSNCLVNSFYNYIWDSINKECVSCQTYIPPTTTTTP